MGFNLWWVRNDGIGGHAWLSLDDMRALVDEMRTQGVEWDPERAHVSAVAIDDALRELASEPRGYVDPELWRDWLSFLRGAAENGGVVVR
jgi:hypothetical protein